MLELKKIKKDYLAGTNVVNALKGATVTFRQSEFVSILGPSGCGKTTMLNIIGGLDKYTSGDLVINGRSTKDFKDYDWDAYRNSYVGFVFQSYNLIPHLTVLGNVELALTLTGQSRSVRKEKATIALQRVGLGDQLNKRPNQLSGGQMQRVAIARAIVNNPQIILADEPTGALDSETSEQVMDLLKEIANERLIIMVTHNQDIAKQYSSRIISLKDGELIGDTNPFMPTPQEREKILLSQGVNIAELNKLAESKELAKNKQAGVDKAKAKEILKAEQAKEKARQKERKAALKKTSMGMGTALGLSARNLRTKKGRTFLISLAGSIGIIGIALVLAISNGFTKYINKFQAETLSSIPISISPTSIDLDALSSSTGNSSDLVDYPDTNFAGIYTKTNGLEDFTNLNKITPEYIDYLLDETKLSKDYYTDILLNYNVKYNLATVGRDSTNAVESIKKLDVKVSDGSSVMSGLFGESSFWQEMIDNKEFIQDDQYDKIAGTYPEAYDEIAIIVDKNNRINSDKFEAMGFSLTTDTKDTAGNSDKTIDFNKLMEKEYIIVHNNDFYSEVTSDKTAGAKDYFVNSDSDLSSNGDNILSNEKTVKLKVVGVLRQKESTAMPIYSPGIIYTQGLTEKILDSNNDSNVVVAQKAELKKASETPFNIIGDDGSAIPIPVTGIPDGSGRDLTTYDANEKEYKSIAESVASSFNSMTGATIDENYIKFLLIASQSEDIKNSIVQNLGETAGMALLGYSALIDSFYYQTQITTVNHFGGYSGTTSNGTNVKLPYSISIYPKTFETKDTVTAHLNAYNEGKASTEKISFTDASAFIASSINNMINIISYVLIAFAAVSLVVSSIMIAIITYTSVLERTKEIGVLRSIGARKKDVSRVFNAETILIGLFAGILGVAVTYLLCIPVNFILNIVISGSGGMATGSLAMLNPLHGLILVAISIALTLISGLIPSRMAAKKDPVVALRST